jgi:hypothetical protein
MMNRLRMGGNIIAGILVPQVGERFLKRCVRDAPRGIASG